MHFIEHILGLAFILSPVLSSPTLTKDAVNGPITVKLPDGVAIGTNQDYQINPQQATLIQDTLHCSFTLTPSCLDANSKLLIPDNNHALEKRLGSGACAGCLGDCLAPPAHGVTYAACCEFLGVRAVHADLDPWADCWNLDSCNLCHPRRLSVNNCKHEIRNSWTAFGCLRRGSRLCFASAGFQNMQQTVALLFTSIQSNTFF